MTTREEALWRGEMDIDSSFYRSTADVRKLFATIDELRDIVKSLLPVEGYPKCDRLCNLNCSPSMATGPYCDCGWDELRRHMEATRSRFFLVSGP